MSTASANTITLCVLGCRAPGGDPWPAQSGYLTCDPCAAELRSTLLEIVELYALLDEALLPGASEGGTRGSPGYGSRSPARDSVLAMTDPRSRPEEEGDPLPVLDVLGSWADNVREDVGLVPREIPEGLRQEGGLLAGWLDYTANQVWAVGILDKLTEARKAISVTLGIAERTVSGEAHFLLQWQDWITRQYWVADLGEEAGVLRHQLRGVLGLHERSVPVGACPIKIRDNGVVRPCGASLRARLGGESITCRSCGTSWPRAFWDMLGDALGTPLSDFASLSAWLTVPNGTLRRWRHEDQWINHNTKSRPLFARSDVLASWQRRRGSARAA